MSTTDAFYDLMAVRVVTTERLRKLLRQADAWVNQEGDEIPLEDIDGRYAANIVRWLDKRAVALHAGERAEYLFLPEPNGEQAQYAVEDERNRLDELEPGKWLQSMPLYRALQARTNALAPEDSR